MHLIGAKRMKPEEREKQARLWTRSIRHLFVEAWSWMYKLRLLRGQTLDERRVNALDQIAAVCR